MSEGKRILYTFSNNILAEYRKDPVPYTGCYKRFGHAFRHPKTHQEMALSYAYSEFVRSKRKASALPNEWDDNYCSNILVKSWKRSKKKKQWM